MKAQSDSERVVYDVYIPTRGDLAPLVIAQRLRVTAKMARMVDRSERIPDEGYSSYRGYFIGIDTNISLEKLNRLPTTAEDAMAQFRARCAERATSLREQAAEWDRYAADVEVL